MVIKEDDLWPRDEEHRYRLYARRGRRLDVLAAAPTPQGIGLAIVTLHEDELAVGRRLADRGVIGILDVLPDRPGPTGDWIIPPWTRGSP